MGKFFIDNTNEDIKDIFRKKQLYRIVSRSEYKNLIDFGFAEKRLYGRVDRNYQPIVPNNNNLTMKYISNQSPQGVQVFDFVAAAFVDLQNKFKIKALAGEIDTNDDFLTDITPVAGFKNPNILYEKYTNAYSAAIGKIINKKSLKFDNFEQFINVAMPFIINSLRDKVFTFPAFVKSKECPPHVSGLVIDIADIDPNNDQVKYDKFYNSRNWNFFLNACNTYGFMVDCNMPNRIVADIGSPYMVSKMATMNSDINNTELFLRDCYDRAAIFNFDKFKQFFYKLYVENKKVSYSTTTTINGDRTRSVIRKPRTYSYDKFLIEYDNEYFLRLYCKIRFMEEESRFTDHEVASLTENTIELSDISFTLAVDCFENILNKTFDYNGSLSYIMQKKAQMGV